ncbi:hypothetical protein BGW39_004741 [Mortierella sp. 14UC]|nr:hypothetical protein BGW39_004741 [Mortierella sp. 14UC]
MIPSLLEIGYVRLTIYELLGLDAVSLGLEDMEGASVFSVWLPHYLSWVQQLPAYPFSAAEMPPLTWSMVINTLSSTDEIRRLCATALQWMVSLPIFSLAPLKPTQLLNPNALSRFLGGGSRLLYSLEDYPHESVFSAIAVGYFVGYAAADLILGYIHYRDQVDPFSGWVHHVVYILLAWRLAIANNLSIFAICGGPLEVSSIFLASGNMFPHLKSAWFPLTFILSRIIGHLLILQEIMFNYPTPSVTAGLFAGAWVMHAFWIYKYFAGVQRRARRAKKAASATLEQAGGKEPSDGDITATTATSTSVSTTGSAGKTIQLRIQKSKK